MRSQLMTVVCCGVFAAVSATTPQVRAQAHGGIFVTPIPNAPFSGTVRVERTDIQPDGSTVHLWSARQIARDNEGRIHNESAPFVPVTVKAPPEVTVIHLYDPGNRMTEYLYPKQKTYRAMILAKPPATDTPDDFASTTAAASPPSDFTRQEDLGYRTIAGLQVHGVRKTQVMTAAESGTGEEVTVTNEYWYSEVLRINLETKHTDPRSGTVTMTVTQIDRHEPNAALFSVPRDYSMFGLAKSSGK